MNKKLIATILIAGASSLNAHMIDLTPGGFNWNQAPQVVQEWYQTVRPYLVLYYPPEQYFSVTGFGTPDINLSWDLHGIGTFQYLFVSGFDPNGDLWANFYQVPQGGEWRFGNAFVTLNGQYNVGFITAFGRYDAPDFGATVLLFGIALLALGLKPLFVQKIP